MSPSMTPITPMVSQLLTYHLPAAYALLPARMQSVQASALVLAIALHESDGCTHRRQMDGGPARGFGQFEMAGVSALFGHPASLPHLVKVMRALQYDPLPRVCYTALEHNDTLMLACMRLNLRTLPQPLPTREDAGEGWSQYVAAWNPGAARDPLRAPDARRRWMTWYPQAWDLVLAFAPAVDPGASGA